MCFGELTDFPRVVNLCGRQLWKRPASKFSNQIKNVLEKAKVRDEKNKRACMKD